MHLKAVFLFDKGKIILACGLLNESNVWKCLVKEDLLVCCAVLAQD